MSNYPLSLLITMAPATRPIEKVWKEAAAVVKKEGTHMKCFPDFDSLQATVKETLLDFADKKEKILALCGMYKRMELQAA